MSEAQQVEAGRHPAEDAETAPSPLLLAMEGRAVGEFALFLQAQVLLRSLPKGDGHPVLVLPGFTTGDLLTTPLRRFLSHRGYAAKGWRQGLNFGIRPALELRMLRRLRELAWLHDQPVSLIGWSLGGIYARELARTHPKSVRQVITLGSPFAGSPRANNVWRIYEGLAGTELENHAKRLAGLDRPLPIPSTAIYSKTDGVVHWKCCVQQTGHQAENIEVRGSHCGLGHNPTVLTAIADRLAQPVDDWKPFDRSGLRAPFYPEPVDF